MEFPLDVLGIIISQLINVHIIISEDAGNDGDGGIEGGRERDEVEVQLPRCTDLCLVQLRLRLGIIEEINCA